MVEKNRIWMDGEIVEYEAAKSHFLSHSLHYGLAVFEGIRSYEGANGRAAIFRLGDHVARLLDSCQIATISSPYTHEQITQAILETLRVNGLTQSYIRPLIWLGEGSINVGAIDNVVHVAIAAWPWGAYLGKGALEKGARCCVSSYRRINVGANYEKAKICGQYVNSVLAKREANQNGFDEAIMLDQQGNVAEGSGENIFLVREGELFTPPRGAAILAGITRDTVIRLAREEGLTVREEMITRSDLYTADEVFLTGTAAELTPVREIDHRRIGKGARGPITERLQSEYFSLVRGGLDRHPSWLAYV